MGRFTAMWSLLAIVLGVIEASTMGLVSIWFCLAAVVSAIVSTFVNSFWIQFAVFVFASAVFLAFTRKFVKRYLVKKKIPTNADAIIGCTGIVIRDIDAKTNSGQVKVNGQIWSAKADMFIPTDCLVRIENISGVKVVVSKIE